MKFNQVGIDALFNRPDSNIYPGLHLTGKQ